MTDLGNDIWKTTIELNPGVYEYKFEMDYMIIGVGNQTGGKAKKIRLRWMWIR